MSDLPTFGIFHRSKKEAEPKIEEKVESTPTSTPEPAAPAVCETKDADEKVIGRLLDHYYEIEAGIGVHKSPEKYGAFPTDAYSHTPGNAGAKQPGMTGQVKEDVISRMRELGVMVEGGKVRFDTSLLNNDELHESDGQFTFIAVSGMSESVDLTANQLAFTFCQVPVVYSLSAGNEIEVLFYDGGVLRIEGDTLDLRCSNMIFNRSGEIKQLNVSVKTPS